MLGVKKKSRWMSWREELGTVPLRFRRLGEGFPLVQPAALPGETKHKGPSRKLRQVERGMSHEGFSPTTFPEHTPTVHTHRTGWAGPEAEQHTCLCCSTHTGNNNPLKPETYGPGGSLSTLEQVTTSVTTT